MTPTEPQWIQIARDGMEEFIHQMREKLPEKPNIAEIEALLFAEQRQLLLNIFQGIVDDSTSFSPRASQHSLDT